MKRTNPAVSSTAALIHSPGGNAEHVVIRNPGPGIVYVGLSGVTTSSGLPLPMGSRVELHGVTSPLFAVTPSSGIVPSFVNLAVNVG